MGRFVTQDAEVVRGADEPTAEVPAPESVDHDPGGEGVLAAGHPAGQLQTAALFGRENGLGEGGAHDLWEAALHLGSEGEITAADVNRKGLGDGAVAYAHEGRGIGRLVLERHEVVLHDFGGGQHLAVERIGILVRDDEQAGHIIEGGMRLGQIRLHRSGRLGIFGLGSGQGCRRAREYISVIFSDSLLVTGSSEFTPAGVERVLWSAGEILAGGEQVAGAQLALCRKFLHLGKVWVVRQKCGRGEVFGRIRLQLLLQLRAGLIGELGNLGPLGGHLCLVLFLGGQFVRCGE